MSEVKEVSITVANSDGTLNEAFLIEGGWFVVGTDKTISGDVVFSIRGMVSPTAIESVLQKTDRYLRTIINDNKLSERKRW